MFSQTLTAQLLRMMLLLAIALLSVHHCPPLLRSLADNAVSAGCHQHSEHHSGVLSQHPHHHLEHQL